MARSRRRAVRLSFSSEVPFSICRDASFRPDRTEVGAGLGRRFARVAAFGSLLTQKPVFDTVGRSGGGWKRNSPRALGSLDRKRRPFPIIHAPRQSQNLTHW